MGDHSVRNIPENWVCESCKANPRIVDESQQPFQLETETLYGIPNVDESEHPFQSKTETIYETVDADSFVGQQFHQGSTDSKGCFHNSRMILLFLNLRIFLDCSCINSI